jgi:hypothetical protein
VNNFLSTVYHGNLLVPQLHGRTYDLYDQQLMKCSLQYIQSRLDTWVCLTQHAASIPGIKLLHFVYVSHSVYS